jgi:hypothetical protein
MIGIIENAMVVAIVYSAIATPVAMSQNTDQQICKVRWETWSANNLEELGFDQQTWPYAGVHWPDPALNGERDYCFEYEMGKQVRIAIRSIDRAAAEK